MFPYLAHFYAKRLCKCELTFPPDSVALLDLVNRALREESRIGMPERAVNFKGHFAVGEVEVEAARKCSASGTDDVLGYRGKAETA